MHWAAKNGQCDVVKLLMGCSEPPDVNARSHGGYAALHVAAMNSKHDVIELLVVVYKADPDVTDFAGRKPIYYLAHNTVSGRRSSALLRRFVQQITYNSVSYCGILKTFSIFTLVRLVVAASCQQQQLLRLRTFVRS